jgi:HAD superfamily hydrolase (TIGR01509 family)
MIDGIFEGTVEILQELQEKGPVYAITNYSAEKFLLSQQRWPFLASFDGVIVSGKVKLTKPDPAIYHRLLNDYNLHAPDCLFIDDNVRNVEVARDIGMQAIRFYNPERLRNDLKELGML